MWLGRAERARVPEPVGLGLRPSFSTSGQGESQLEDGVCPALPLLRRLQPR